MRIFSLCLIVICYSGLMVAQSPDRFVERLSPINQLNTKQVDDRAALDLTAFFGVVDRMLALQDVEEKSIGTAQLADILWKYDEPQSRQMFEKAMTFQDGKTDPANLRLLRRMRLRIVKLIAKHDVLWAKHLIEAKTPADQEAGDNQDQNIAVASSLLAEEPDAAIDFANRSLQRRVDPSFVWLLKQLRATRQRDADQLFLQAVRTFAQEPNANTSDFAMLGTYIFTSPKASAADPTSVILTRVGNVGIVDITVDQPQVPPQLVRAFIAGGVELLSRPIIDPYQRQTGYALGYLLFPKAQIYAPDLVPLLSMALTSLSIKIPSELTQEAAFANLRKARRNASESIAEADKVNDPQIRDVAYLDAAFQAWVERDFETARTAASKLSQEQPATAVKILIEFGEGSAALRETGGLRQAEAIASRLPSGIERSILFLGVGQTSQKLGDREKSLQAISLALHAAETVNDARKPYLVLVAAAQLANQDSELSRSALSESIKDFNKADDAALKAVSWHQRVEIGPLVEKFPLDVEGVDFGFARAFRAASAGSVEDATVMANALRNESLRAAALVEVARAILTSVPHPGQNKERVVRVEEDGIRKSALKSVMPEYPQQAVKDRKRGMAVVEVQYDGKGIVSDVKTIEAPAPDIERAVVDAVKQWKFRPSTYHSEPISVRGKLTFYFVLDSEGKPHVENPKQFK